MISLQDQWRGSKDQRSKIITSDLDHPKDQDHWLRRSFREIKIVIFYNYGIGFSFPSSQTQTATFRIREGTNSHASRVGVSVSSMH